MASAGKPRRVLMIVENLPVPFDRRVWQEATTLRDAGYQVSVICPTGPGCERRREVREDIHIYRHPLPIEAEGAAGYALEYASALFWEFFLALRIALTRGFDVLHGCNPPDTIFLIGGFFKLFGKKFLFDHHDINPELYEAKFGRRDRFYRLLLALERWTFRTADVSLATNQSYRRIALERGRMDPERVFVVRSGPNLSRLQRLPPVQSLRGGRSYLVGYVGVMGRQEGIDYLLRAVRHIVHELGRHDIHFGLVGGGTELAALQAYAEELKVAEYVTFTGRVPDRQLLEMLNTADVCVNPDVANEMNDKSTMNKIMEYMALGKPIVQFDLTEGRYSAGESSLYARPNDAQDLAAKLVELIDDPPRRARMGELGRARVENELEWRYEAPKLLAAYERLFAAGAARGTGVKGIFAGRE
ncbi:glycosyltransferase family 4 protein [Alkalilimnicola sp. S0819]|uniref:glycosyltransferase family 4 protein n=1 Tax=Alkalilimnicola sp. S0819 TaxID=2613922 RepID=UPI0012617AF7|nr:glycosyltransferase family 4 protein [Alkalilimnicola sp. S0819]KAB7627893.1 glycosyltransferase family 4 protein [Alkalilimnicola sp. S0819]MPQ15529.1 glycosyltransferase [Alkalilimnicola sp. S0819]